MEKKISKIADTFLVDSDQLESLDLHLVASIVTIFICNQKSPFVTLTHTSSHLHHKPCHSFYRETEGHSAMVPNLGGDIEDAGTGPGTRPI
ncbi:hypothetical protein VNO80_11057 [Phaseolus coccineus]|uniref:Uncharacterized protein n=1 Tax=Phaseolus coccineus TaxID=3886 RepID=A0AAN9NFP0_PHACN